MLTFQDAFDSLLGYMGAAPSTDTKRDARQSIDEALRELVNAHNWSYYYTHGRVNCNAPFTTGTVQYQLSSGAEPRLLTLTGATWPAWAFGGAIRIGVVVYEVDQVIDSTHLTLTAELSPVVDLAAGTNYILYQDTYPLEVDFIAQDQALYEYCFGGLQYVHPREWLFGNRWIYNTGVPRYYTIQGNKKYPNRMCVSLTPLPVDNKTLDYIYKRRARPLIWQSATAGTVSLVQGSSAITGSGTTFDPTMAGSVIRLSANAQAPTWMPGANPGVFEGIIQSVSASNSANLTAPAPQAYTAASYIISDPIDIETGSMANAFLRCCEAKLAQHRIMKDKPDAKDQYRTELIRAMEADSRSFANRAEGEGGAHRQRMKDMPLGPDAS